MSGHSHWKQVKYKKANVDIKKGKIFSRIIRNITLAAQTGGADQNFNPKLRSWIEEAKKNQIPQETIERAIERAKEKKLEELTLEAYGPGGTGLIIEVIVSNKADFLSKIKKILESNQGKMVNPGGVKFLFENKDGKWLPKFQQEISQEDKEKLENLLSELGEMEEIQDIFHNEK